MPAHWSRRTVLGLGLAGAVTVLAGCTEEAPPDRSSLTGPPPSPSPTPATPEVPDAAVLLAALDRARALHDQAAAISLADAPQAARLEEAVNSFGEQARVLEEVLAAGGVPLPASPSDRADTAAGTSSPDGVTGTAQPDTATATVRPGDAATSSVDPAERTREAQQRARRAEREVRLLAASTAEDVSDAALESLSAVSSANLAMLTSLAGQRGALGAALGGDPHWPARPGPEGSVAATMLPSFQAAVYAFEVIAARSRGEERERAEQTLRGLRTLTSGLTNLAGPDAEPAPLGYGLEADVSTTEGRTDLARQVLAALPAVVVQEAGDHTGDVDAVAGTVRLLAGVVELGREWGLEIAPFPGMTLP